MCIFDLLVLFLDMVFELQNRLMKKLLFKKMIYLFLNFLKKFIIIFLIKKINLLQRDFQSKLLQYVKFIITRFFVVA